MGPDALEKLLVVMLRLQFGQMGLEGATDFLLVLIWPTWPQLAHLRRVGCVCLPVGVPLPAASGEPAPPSGEPAVGFFFEARFLLRAWLVSSRAISWRMLRNVSAIRYTGGCKYRS